MVSVFIMDGQRQERTSGWAIASMVTGMMSFIIPLLFSVVAIVLGHVALAKIRREEGIVGKGLAMFGLVLGYFTFVVVGLVIAVIWYGKVKEAEEIALEEVRGKRIYALVVDYEKDHGKFPDRLSALVEKGYVKSLDELQPTHGDKWIYFQGLSSESDKWKYFIRSEGHKVIVYVNGEVGDRRLFFTMEPTDYPMEGHEKVVE